MSDYHGTFQHFKNSDSSFTELLSILVKYDFYSDDAPSLEYNTAELKIICQHINNASDILLQGIQDVGNLISDLMRRDKQYILGKNIGDFIAILCNLIESLDKFRQDANYVITKRAECKKFKNTKNL